MLKTTVAEVMTPGVSWASPGTPFRSLVATLSAERVSALPVVDVEGVVVGVVSEADLMLKELFGFRPSSARPALAAREWRKLDATVAADLMTSPAITVGAGATLVEAARLMHDHEVKRLPVVDGDGRLVGIVSRGDLLAVFMRPDAEIRREILDEVVLRMLWLEPSRVEVAVEGGAVTLRGRVDRFSDIAVLAGLVRGVEGVVAVRTELGCDLDDREPASAAWQVVV